MTVLFILAAIAIAAWAASIYVRKAASYLKASEAPWDRLFEATKLVLADPAMPDKVVGFAVAATMCSGCGCLTRQALIDYFRGKFRRSSVALAKPDPVLSKMTAEQRERFDAIVINAIYYDSLRAPLSGFLARRLIFPWLKRAAEGTDKLAFDRRAAALARSSRKAIANRPDGRKLLVLAH